MSSTVTKVKCQCQHEQQDKMHGQGVRVANRTAKGDKDSSEARCTVCGKIHRVSNERFH